MIFVLPQTATLGSRLTAYYPSQQLYMSESNSIAEILKASRARSRGDVRYILHLAILVDNIVFWRHNASQV